MPFKLKKLFAFLMLCAVTLTIISCQEDEDDDMSSVPAELVGTWRLTQEGGAYIQDQTYRADGTGRQTATRNGTVIFQSDLTFTVTGNSIVARFTDPQADADADYPEITYEVSSDGQSLFLTFTYPGQDPFTNEHIKI